jgi:hypothetical protein
MASAVSKIEVVKRNFAMGDGRKEAVVKVKLWFWNKNQALELLFKHLGLIEPKKSRRGWRASDAFPRERHFRV